jgi:hypothetical protein
MAKKIAFVFCLGVFFALNASAYMVSFFIIETGLPLEGAKTQYSKLWENTFFDVFFDAGYIVCNSPMMRIESKPKMSLEKFVQNEVDEARDGGADYFLVAQLDYSGGSTTPREVSLVLFTVTPFKLIKEQKVMERKYKSEKEEFEDLKSIVKGIVPKTNEN